MRRLLVIAALAACALAHADHPAPPCTDGDVCSDWYDDGAGGAPWLVCWTLEDGRRVVVDCPRR